MFLLLLSVIHHFSYHYVYIIHAIFQFFNVVYLLAERTCGVQKVLI